MQALVWAVLAAAALSGTSSRSNLDGAAIVAPGRPNAKAGRDLVGTVTDSATGKPLPGGDVVVSKGGSVVARVTTDGFGRFTVHDLDPGTYQVVARYIGFRADSRPVEVTGGAGSIVLAIRLGPQPVELQAIEVSANLAVAVDTRTGDQVFKQTDYHGAPTNTTSQILQQSISGAARAPTGEVHIRGQHAEYTYYIDGVPVPAGISGSLNELFDPAVVNQISFQTGSWDAEYGNKNAAIVNITTRVPSGPLHVDASTYFGSFNSNGQTLSASTSAGKFGFFFSGTRQVTDMRREPLVSAVDPATNRITDVINFHNHGQDLFGFAKMQYVPSANDVINLSLNLSRTRFAAPYDSTGGVVLDDHQQDVNSFQNLGWQHLFPRGSELFVAAFHRAGSLDYTPGIIDQPQFIFFPDPTPYNLREDRNFNTTGLKLDYLAKLSDHYQLKFGVIGSLTRGQEDFVTTDAQGNQGPASNSDLKGSDVGVYAQTVIAPSEKWEIRTGVRYDNHEAPFAASQHQLSPRIRLSLFPNAANTIWFYYGRLFLPTNVEDLRAITSVAQEGVVATPTLPERDHFFELGYVHRFPAGVVLKLSGYHKVSSPGIDDNTVPGSAIVTSVNLDRVWINGIESVLEIRPSGPLTGYLNLALNHAYGRGPITGGFFPADTPEGLFDLDHDQRLSAVANINYAAHRFFMSVTGIYGSGLTNGADPDASYGTGLFDFNRLIKVDPSTIVNLAAGYSFALGGASFRPALYIDNVFDRKYLLKGAFFSGPSVGRPRAVQVRVNVGF
ncbi:MAG: TonB-dependent receptor [Gemmatimonadota bacterium]